MEITCNMQEKQVQFNVFLAFHSGIIHNPKIFCKIVVFLKIIDFIFLNFSRFNKSRQTLTCKKLFWIPNDINAEFLCCCKMRKFISLLLFCPEKCANSGRKIHETIRFLLLTFYKFQPDNLISLQLSWKNFARCGV